MTDESSTFPKDFGIEAEQLFQKFQQVQNAEQCEHARTKGTLGLTLGKHTPITNKG